MLEAALSRNRPLAERTPQRLGADMVAIFQAIEPMPDKVQWVHREIARRLGPDLDPALDRACGALATMIDADPASFDLHAYHNRQHYCEVALTAFFLCELQRTPKFELQVILLAALIHDVVHDGRANAPFCLERESVRRALPLLAAQGVGRPAQARIEALVLATDPALGTHFVAAARAFHQHGGALPAVPAAAPELIRLLGDARLARSAGLLCEADILPSIGLTTDHAMRLQRRLADEWGRPLDNRDKLDFIRGALACGFVGEFFLPNVHALRSHLAGLPDATAAG